MQRIVFGLLLAAACVMPGCGGAKEPRVPKTVQWDDAKNYVGKTTTVIGPVLTVNTDRYNNVTLSVGTKEDDPNRFVVIIRGVTGPLPELVGKNIGAKGTIAMTDQVPTVMLGGLKDLTFPDAGP
jgi:hypothetical protein